MNRKTIAFIILGAIPALTTQGQKSSSSQEIISISSSKTGQRTSYKSNYGVSNFNVESGEKFELSDDEKNKKSMSPDGYLKKKKTFFGNRRSIVITPGGN